MTVVLSILIPLVSVAVYIMIGGYLAGLAHTACKDDFDRDMTAMVMRVLWPLAGTLWGAYVLAKWAQQKPFELGRSYPERKSARAAKRDPAVPLVGRLLE